MGNSCCHRNDSENIPFYSPELNHVINEIVQSESIEGHRDEIRNSYFSAEFEETQTNDADVLGATGFTTASNSTNSSFEGHRDEIRNSYSSAEFEETQTNDADVLGATGFTTASNSTTNNSYDLESHAVDKSNDVNNTLDDISFEEKIDEKTQIFISDDVSCGICMIEYDHSKCVATVLPCGHILCLNCVREISKEENFRKCTCPWCMKEHNIKNSDDKSPRDRSDLPEERGLRIPDFHSTNFTPSAPPESLIQPIDRIAYPSFDSDVVHATSDFNSQMPEDYQRNVIEFVDDNDQRDRSEITSRHRLFDDNFEANTDDLPEERGLRFPDFHSTNFTPSAPPECLIQPIDRIAYPSFDSDVVHATSGFNSQMPEDYQRNVIGEHFYMEDDYFQSENSNVTSRIRHLNCTDHTDNIEESKYRLTDNSFECDLSSVASNSINLDFHIDGNSSLVCQRSGVIDSLSRNILARIQLDGSKYSKLGVRRKDSDRSNNSLDVGTRRKHDDPSDDSLNERSEIRHPDLSNDFFRVGTRRRRPDHDKDSFDVSSRQRRSGRDNNNLNVGTRRRPDHPSINSLDLGPRRRPTEISNDSPDLGTIRRRPGRNNNSLEEGTRGIRDEINEVGRRRRQVRSKDSLDLGIRRRRDNPSISSLDRGARRRTFEISNDSLDQGTIRRRPGRNNNSLEEGSRGVRDEINEVGRRRRQVRSNDSLNLETTRRRDDIGNYSFLEVGRRRRQGRGNDSLNLGNTRRRDDVSNYSSLEVGRRRRQGRGNDSPNLGTIRRRDDIRDC
ncbi:hypothetical protein ACF0H5_024304 [Mactra antiquata]